MFHSSLPAPENMMYQLFGNWTDIADAFSGFLGESWDEEALLQQVLAQSQQEYFDQFKKNSEKPASAEQQMEGVDDGDGGAVAKSGQDSS